MKDLSEILETDFVSSNRVDAYTLMSYMLSMISHNRMLDIDAILSSTNFDKISVRCVGILFRSTYSFRHILPNWEDGLVRAKLSIDSRGIDSSTVFRGFVPLKSLTL